MYRVDRALLEETSDEAERPITSMAVLGSFSKLKPQFLSIAV